MHQTSDKSPILVVGDLMLDHYIRGTASRLSPEAPVPVILVQQDSFALGGAANVANNLAGIETYSHIFGPLGDDEYRGKFLEKIPAEMVGDATFTVSNFPTIVKCRVVSGFYQIVRFDREKPFIDHDMAIVALHKQLIANHYPIIIVSDYGKGLCSPEIMKVIGSYATSKGCKVLVDPKGTDWEKYRGAFLVKPNLKELSDIIGYTIPNDNFEVEKFGRKIIQSFDLQHLLITRSEKGMTLLSLEEVLHIPSEAKTVYDVSGAGDTVIAVLAYCMQMGYSLPTSARLANIAAGKVIEKAGTVIITKKELFSKGIFNIDEIVTQNETTLMPKEREEHA